MVCRKSLYCWKNGPCASDQARKQIWEDNIKFRENLKDINQSDHYWSFQISKSNCLCLEGEELWYNRPLSRKYYSGSLQRLHQIDCTSITHDCNDLKFRNCYIHCPIHDFKKVQREKADTPTLQLQEKKLDSLSCQKCPLYPEKKPTFNKPEFGKVYKNTLSNSAMKPVVKTKCLSQTNVNLLQNTKNLQKEYFNSSCENLFLKSSDKAVETSVKQPETTSERLLETEPKTRTKEESKSKKLNPEAKVSSNKSFHFRAPILETTKKILNEAKQTPFATYGCNNKNLNIGLKKTHNVHASKSGVYPSKYPKEQKKDLMFKYIQSEQEFQRKCTPEKLRKKFVNHSSVWSLDNSGKESKLIQIRNTKYLPAMSKTPQRLKSNQLDSGYYQIIRKPQIHFY